MAGNFEEQRNREARVLRESLSVNTRKSYDLAWQWWVDDARALGVSVVPTAESVRCWILAATADLLQFASMPAEGAGEQALQRSWCYPTAAKAVAAVDHHLRMALLGEPVAVELAGVVPVQRMTDVSVPGQDPQLRSLLSALRRLDERVRAEVGRDAMSLADLRLVVADLELPGSLAGRDFLAALCHQLLEVSWEALSEMVCADVRPRGLVVAGRLRRWKDFSSGAELGRLIAKRLATGHDGARPLFRAGGKFGTARLKHGGLRKAALAVLGPMAAGGGDPHGSAWVDLLWQRACGCDRVARVRAQALLAIGWWGALRRDALAGLRPQDVTFLGEVAWLQVKRKGGGQYIVVIPRLPERQAAWCPVRRLEAWCALAEEGLGPSEAALFPRVGSTWRPADGSAMDGDAVNTIIVEAAVSAGVRGNIGAHSLRVGLITEVVGRGGSLSEAREISGHKRLQDVRCYVRPVATRFFNGLRGWRFDELSGEEALVA